MAELEVTKATKKTKIGLEDGGHIILECSNCLCPLVDVFVTSPKMDVSIDVVAHCYKCKDKSFIKKIKGGFHPGGTDYSVITNINLDNPEVAEFFTAKGEKEWAK